MFSEYLNQLEDLYIQPDYENEFINERELIISMARKFLNNLKISPDKININNNKFCLVTSAQMLGSGKTHLGYIFLTSLKRILEGNQNLKKELIMEYGEDNLKSLLNARYVYADLRNLYSIKDKTLEDSITALTFYSIYNTLDAKRKKEASEKYRTLPCPTLLNVIKYFQETLQCLIYVNSDDQTLPSYAQFWQQIHNAMIIRGHPVYCSGKSYFLYSLGKNNVTFEENAITRRPTPASGLSLHCQLSAFQFSTIQTIIKNYDSELQQDQIVICGYSALDVRGSKVGNTTH